MNKTWIIFGILLFLAISFDEGKFQQQQKIDSAEQVQTYFLFS